MLRVPPDPLPMEPYFRRFPGALPFLRAIAEDPENLHLRLVLADFLEEAGQPTRADFIRVKCRIAEMPDCVRCRRPAEAEADTLWHAGSGEWLDGLPAVRGFDWDDSYNYPLGLLELLRVPFDDDSNSFLPVLNELLPVTDWLEIVIGPEDARVRIYGGDSIWTDRAMSRFCAVRYINNELSWFRTPRLLLLASPYIAQLRRLDLRGNRLGHTGALELAGASLLANLRRLGVARNEIGDAGAAAVLAARQFAGLDYLDLGENKLTTDVVKSFRGATHLSGLRHLDLSRNALRDKGVTVLVSLPHLAGLTYLDLGVNCLGDGAATALASFADFENLTHLGLYGNNIRDHGAVALSRAVGLPNLACLDVRQTGISVAGMKVLRERFPVVRG